MFVFIDESGTPPLKGPQSYFAMSAIAFQTEANRDGLEEAVKQLRLDWGMKATDEIKFADCSGQRKTKFFEMIGDLPFKHSSCVLWKDGLSGQWTDQYYAYERVIREIVTGLEPHFREVDEAQEKPLRIHVVYDEYTDPEYDKLLKQEFGRLHSKDGSKMVSKGNVKKGRSQSSSLLQAVDMVCGAHRWDTKEFRKYVAAQRLRFVELP